MKKDPFNLIGSPSLGDHPMKKLEVCPYRDSSLGNRDPYIRILVPTHDPLP
jgi:hypothetical protein